jgi:hypothetical protein
MIVKLFSLFSHFLNIRFILVNEDYHLLFFINIRRVYTQDDAVNLINLRLVF